MVPDPSCAETDIVNVAAKMVATIIRTTSPTGHIGAFQFMGIPKFQTSGVAMLTHE
jgi:hypothetical protein